MHQRLRPVRLARLENLLFAGFFCRRVHHLVAGREGIALIELVVAQARERVARGLVVQVGNQQYFDTGTRLGIQDVRTLFVEQEGAHIDRGLDMQGTGIFLDGLFLQDA